MRAVQHGVLLLESDFPGRGSLLDSLFWSVIVTPPAEDQMRLEIQNLPNSDSSLSLEFHVLVYIAFTRVLQLASFQVAAS